MTRDFPFLDSQEEYSVFLSNVVRNQFSFVVYHFPNSKRLHFLFSENNFEKKNINKITQKKNLFLLSDFFWQTTTSSRENLKESLKKSSNTSQKSNPYFHVLAPDIIGEIELHNTADKVKYKKKRRGKYLKGSEKLFHSLLNSSAKQVTIPTLSRDKTVSSTLKKDYIAQVEYAQKEIAKNRVEKVVLSKIKKKKIAPTFSGLDVFNSLLKKYHNCFVYILYDPKMGYWMGATPEVLISENENKNWEVMSLAGTQVKKNLSVEKVAWQQKEIKEQALVTNYVIDCFKQVRLRAFIMSGPKTIQVGNLLHLLTVLTIEVNKMRKQISWFPLVKLLHPTSAICGMPEKESLKIISKLEKHNRKIYTGLIGVHNGEPHNALYVNLRCVEIDLKNQFAYLYSGAGITDDSDPKKEWEETQNKIAFLDSLI